MVSNGLVVSGFSITFQHVGSPQIKSMHRISYMFFGVIDCRRCMFMKYISIIDPRKRRHIPYTARMFNSSSIPSPLWLDVDSFGSFSSEAVGTEVGFFSGASNGKNDMFKNEILSLMEAFSESV